jgi:hypothetical protein
LDLKTFAISNIKRKLKAGSKQGKTLFSVKKNPDNRRNQNRSWGQKTRAGVKRPHPANQNRSREKGSGSWALAAQGRSRPA